MSQRVGAIVFDVPVAIGGAKNGYICFSISIKIGVGLGWRKGIYRDKAIFGVIGQGVVIIVDLPRNLVAVVVVRVGHGCS